MSPERIENPFPRRYASPSATHRRKKATFSSCVWSTGRKSSVAKDGSKIATIASTSSSPARLITAVLYERAAREERARPPDPDLHPRRRSRGDEPRRRLAHVEARPAHPRLRDRRRAQ